MLISGVVWGYNWYIVYMYYFTRMDLVTYILEHDWHAQFPVLTISFGRLNEILFMSENISIHSWQLWFRPRHGKIALMLCVPCSDCCRMQLKKTFLMRLFHCKTAKLLIHGYHKCPQHVSPVLPRRCSVWYTLGWQNEKSDIMLSLDLSFQLIIQFDGNLSLAAYSKSPLLFLSNL